MLQINNIYILSECHGPGTGPIILIARWCEWRKITIFDGFTQMLACVTQSALFRMYAINYIVLSKITQLVDWNGKKWYFPFFVSARYIVSSYLSPSYSFCVSLARMFFLHLFFSHSIWTFPPFILGLGFFFWPWCPSARFFSHNRSHTAKTSKIDFRRYHF